MKRIQSVILLLAVSSGFALFWGCGDNESTPPEPATIDDGWSEFEAGNYTAAISIFREVLEDDGGKIEARNGLGWSFAYSGEPDSARHHFESAIASDEAMVDAKAGLCAVLLALEDADGAIAGATDALDLDDDWSFSHASGVDHEDLRLILAQAYFSKGEDSWEMAQSEVDVLDPSNGLDPANSSTWDGHPTYGAALLKLIQEIEESVGSDMLL